MVEKNTLSILESIKKKIQKFDEPKKTDNKDFSEIGDEFNYLGSAENSQVSGNADLNQESAAIKDDKSLDPNLQNQNLVDESLKEEAFSKDDDVDLELDDDLKFDEDLDFVGEDSQEASDDEASDEDSQEISDDDQEEDLDFVDEDSQEASDDEASDEDSQEISDDDQEEDLDFVDEDSQEDSQDASDEDSQEIFEEDDGNVDFLKSEEVLKEYNHTKSDEDELEEILQQDSAPKDSKNLISDKSVSSIAESIKKLVDAKNVVSGVTSFSQSEAFSDIAKQLMEPKLEAWLNENLPSLVEKIVREEIKKIIPKD